MVYREQHKFSEIRVSQLLPFHFISCESPTQSMTIWQTEPPLFFFVGIWRQRYFVQYSRILLSEYLDIFESQGQPQPFAKTEPSHYWKCFWAEPPKIRLFSDYLLALYLVCIWCIMPMELFKRILLFDSFIMHLWLHYMSRRGKWHRSP